MSITLVWEDDSGANVVMQFDVHRQETHEGMTVVTEHPVEVGADIADHVRDELDRFTIEGFVTDTPTNRNNIRDEVFKRLENVGTIKAVELQIPEPPFKFGVSSAIGAGISALGNLISGAINGPPKANILTFDDFKSRVRIVHDLLQEVRLSHRKVRIVTLVRDYDDMLLEQMTVTRSKEDGSGATFVCSFREIRTVDSDITVAPSPAEALGASQKAAGSKSAKKDNELVDGKNRSFAKGIAGLTGKYLDENGGVVGAVSDLVTGAF